jgi:hypothetical protein
MPKLNKELSALEVKRLPPGLHFVGGVGGLTIQVGDYSEALKRSPASWVRSLTVFGNKMKIEASVLLGDRDEEVEIYGKPDCWDFGRRRSGFAGGRGL